MECIYYLRNEVMDAKSIRIETDITEDIGYNTKTTMNLNKQNKQCKLNKYIKALQVIMLQPNCLLKSVYSHSSCNAQNMCMELLFEAPE